MLQIERERSTEVPPFLDKKNNPTVLRHTRKENESIFYQGDRVIPNCVYWLVSGLAVREVSKVSDDITGDITDDITIVEVLRPGDFFGTEDWGKETHSSTVRTLEVSTILSAKIREDDINAKMALANAMLAKVAALKESLEVRSSGEGPAKIAYGLLDFAVAANNGMVKLSQRTLAKRAGTGRRGHDTTTSALNTLETDGCIRRINPGTSAVVIAIEDTDKLAKRTGLIK